MKNFSLLILVLFFVSCQKQSKETLPQNDKQSFLIEEAQNFFEQNIANLPQNSNGGVQKIAKQPAWDSAFIKRLSDKEVVIVPVNFPKDLYLKLENGKVSLSASDVTRLIVYKDSANKMTAEVVTTLPDSRYLKDTAEEFTGMVWVTDWQGKPLRNFRYDPEHHARKVSLTMKTSRDTSNNARRVQCAYVDYYSCVSAFGNPYSCTYSYTVSLSCEPGNNGEWGAVGGIQDWDYPEIGGGGNNGGGGITGVNENTTLVQPPTKIIDDPFSYIKCFSVNSQNAYSVTVYVQQPKPGTRAVLADAFGETDLLAMQRRSATVGHTFMAFEQVNSDGTVVRRTMGFYPRDGSKPTAPSSPGVLNDNSGDLFHVSLKISIDHQKFFDLLYDCARGNTETYDLNTLNCSGWTISKLKSIGVNLPETHGSWFSGGGLNPADLGEDIRNMKLESNMQRNTEAGNSLSNSGTCQ